MEGGCFPPAINNTSVQPRLQGQEAAQHKGNGLGCRLERYKRTEKNDERVPKLFELWLCTQTCV